MPSEEFRNKISENIHMIGDMNLSDDVKCNYQRFKEIVDCLQLNIKLLSTELKDDKIKTHVGKLSHLVN